MWQQWHSGYEHYESSNPVHTLPSYLLKFHFNITSHLQIDLPCAVFNVCISVLHHTWKCSTSRKVAGSIPDGDIGIFHWHNPSGRTVFPGSTQTSIQISTRYIFGGVKAAGVCRLSWNLGASTSWNPPVLSSTVQGLFLLFIILIFCYSSSNSFKHFLISPPSVISSYEVVTGMNRSKTAQRKYYIFGRQIITVVHVTSGLTNVAVIQRLINNWYLPISEVRHSRASSHNPSQPRCANKVIAYYRAAREFCSVNRIKESCRGFTAQTSSWCLTFSSVLFYHM